MDIIFSASIIASFFAGMVALFAPCCITVLLPAYLASAFREKKHILKMTLVFFAGIATILIPIGLGAAWLAQVFANFHTELYIFGGLLMIMFALGAFLGKGMALIPMPKRMMRGIDAANSQSVFMLGLFSGAATSWCAPVLAGDMTLAVISGAFWKALVVTFVYVFGMTFPLFIAALLYERFKLEESRLIRGKIFEVRIRQKTIFVHSTNLLAGIVFLAIGLTLIFLGVSGNAFWGTHTQVAIGGALNRWSIALVTALMRVPEAIWGAIIIGIFFYLLYLVKKSSQK